MGRLDEAREHLELCRAIAGNGEDWRARAGHVALAEAAVEAATSGQDAAAPLFTRAQTIFARYGLAGDDMGQDGRPPPAAETIDDKR